MGSQHHLPIVDHEWRRVVVVAPAGRAKQVVVGELRELGYAVMSATSVEAALAFVRTGLMDAVVVLLSRFPTATLRRLAHGLLPHPEVSLIGGVSVFSAERPSCRWTTCWAGFASARQLAKGLDSRRN
jgi:hypothetical protein